MYRELWVFGTMKQGNLLNYTTEIEDYNKNKGIIKAPGFPQKIKVLFDIAKGM